MPRDNTTQFENDKTTVATLLRESGPLALPGVFDALSAKIAERTGFPLGFISGYSVSATMLGEPDFGLLTQTEMLHRAKHVCASVDIPILVDADTGYGNPMNVYRTVQELIAIGAKGCFLEDQVWPKRCGHMQGKDVIDQEDYLDKMRAAVEARGDRDFFIVARTDALAIHGMDEAVTRVTAAREIGANASFIEAPTSIEDLQTIGQLSPAPNVANMIEGGRTPVVPTSQLGEWGFHLIMYPLCGLFSAAKTMQAMFETLQQTGTTTGHEDKLMTFDQFNSLIGLNEKLELSKKFGKS